MLHRSEKHMMLQFLRNGRNDTFNIFSNVYEKGRNKIFLRTYVTATNYMESCIITRNGLFLPIINTSKKDNQVFKTSLKKCFATTNGNASGLSNQYSKNDVSILQNSNVIILFNKNEKETIGQKLYRYLDITGFLTRYNCRKEWILDLEPYSRLTTVMLTEYERKLMIFLKFHVYFLFVTCLYLWYHAQVHFTMKPPCPKPYAYGHLDGRKRDFTWHGKLFFIYPKTRCKECRWLDVQCKKECFQKLKQEGHKFFINNGDPLSVPKTVLYPSHFH
ncbi:hypothetical protein AK88_03990 [Plasmodium fragile]|uniref:Uncharacterized protein n=1 Tax=Plasmodium fragile TaxID=5857 RepID=A0A0D9QHT0_PLAFR|nr:uncharacterized protein AK88_03990 [Plasmodium fragile]KJP86357.1 hypothetical protein AK88_03990 [Plasmodium fragile]